MANYSFQDPDLPDGTVINGGNFTQFLPNTEIMVGKTLTINGGNFVNVKKQPTWTINGGNWTQIDRCSHLNPKLIALGLPVCAADCKHKVGEDVIQVGGTVVDTVRHYEDLIVGV
jgi:hypothetical protein